jgi:hypothetical protein
VGYKPAAASAAALFEASDSAAECEICHSKKKVMIAKITASKLHC